MKYGVEGGYGSVPKKRRKGLFVKVLIFIVFLLVLGILFWYKFIYSVNYFKIALNKTFDYLEEVIENGDYDSIVNNFSVQMKLQSASQDENKFFEMFNNVSFSGSYGIDYDKNIVSVDFYSRYEDKELLDINFYSQYGRGYVFLDGLYDKYIDYSIDNYSDIFDKKLDESRNIVVGVRKAILSSLKGDYFEKEKVTINNDRMTKMTLDLTDDNYQLFVEDVVDKLLDNKSFLDSYALLFDVDRHYLKEKLNDIVDDSKDYDGEKYFLYIKDFNFVKFVSVSGDNRFVVLNDDGKYEYEAYEDEVKLYNGIVSFVYNKENSSEMTLLFYDIEDEVSIEVMIDITTEVNGDIELEDISNSVSFEKISDEDIEVIRNNLSKNEGVVTFLDELFSLVDFDDSKNYLPVFRG